MPDQNNAPILELTEHRMPINLPSLIRTRTALTLFAGLALAGCASLERHSVPVEATQNDDDSYCRQNGVAQGSDAYVACRKDRDVQRSHAADKIERQHRNLAERMLNGQ